MADENKIGLFKSNELKKFTDCIIKGFPLSRAILSEICQSDQQLFTLIYTWLKST